MNPEPFAKLSIFLYRLSLRITAGIIGSLVWRSRTACVENTENWRHCKQQDHKNEGDAFAPDGRRRCCFCGISVDAAGRRVESEPIQEGM